MLRDDFSNYLQVTVQVIAMAYLDNSFRESFLDNPKNALQAQLEVAGLAPLPDDLLVQIDESSKASWRIVPLSYSPLNKAILYIPFPPQPPEISDEDLGQLGNITATRSTAVSGWPWVCAL